MQLLSRGVSIYVDLDAAAKKHLVSLYPDFNTVFSEPNNTYFTYHVCVDNNRLVIVRTQLTGNISTTPNTYRFAYRAEYKFSMPPPIVEAVLSAAVNYGGGLHHRVPGSAMQ